MSLITETYLEGLDAYTINTPKPTRGLDALSMSELSPQPTPISTSTALDEDLDGETVDQKEYMSMIGLCARYQASPRTSHRQVVKRIFKYLKFTLEFGLWYSVDSSLVLVGFSDTDFGGCRLDRKSTSDTCQFLGTSLVLGPLASRLA